MKGKYTKKRKKNVGFFWILLVTVLLCAGIFCLWLLADKQPENVTDPSAPAASQSTAPGETGVPGETAGSIGSSEESGSTEPSDGEGADVPSESAEPSEPDDSTRPQVSTEPAETEAPFRTINLGYGVNLEKVAKYTGIYMEDGSDELVSGVMMIRVTNTGEEDIQLMDIEVAYQERIYRFKLTNLAAGATAALLELDRAAMPQGNPSGAVAKNTVLFPEPMAANPESFEISGMSGAMNVKNISGADISGDIYVYYKYKTQGVYYGGITFRVSVRGGLKADEVRQIMTSHFDPDRCEVVMIEVKQADGI